MDTINNHLLDRHNTASKMWQDREGWRGWTRHTEKNRILFNDIPETSLIKAMEILAEWDGEAQW